jgi:hypothetical protein
MENNKMKNNKMKISYCTTCCNRLWQLALTLPVNLKNLKDKEELVLVNYGSKDDLNKYIKASKLCQNKINEGKLKYIEVLNVSEYNCPKSKNIAHRFGTGKFLVNLDADNYNEEIRETILNIKNENVIVHMKSNREIKANGTFGKIAISKNNFYKLGGYDESLLPIAFQDWDLLKRAEAMGIRKLEIPLAHKFIFNSVEEKIKFTGYSDWDKCNHINYWKSHENIKENRLIANKESGWGEATVKINFEDQEKLYKKIFPK